MRRSFLLTCLALMSVPSLAWAAGKPAYVAPRTEYGQPDLQGAWDPSTITPFERRADFPNRLAFTEAEAAKVEGAVKKGNEQATKPSDLNVPFSEFAKKCEVQSFDAGVNCAYNNAFVDASDTVMRVHGEPRTSFITTTPDGKLPACKPGKTRPRYTQDTDNPEGLSQSNRCIIQMKSGPVMTPAAYSNFVQVYQNRDEVIMVQEQFHNARHIRLNVKEHLPSNIRSWMGDAIGHFEGDTLVVETTNFPLEQPKWGSSPNLKVIEKFRRVGPDRLLYQFRVEDPETWVEPWGGEYEFSLKHQQLYEVACHEGNYALADILQGAREREAKAAANGGQAKPVPALPEGE